MYSKNEIEVKPKRLLGRDVTILIGDESGSENLLFVISECPAGAHAPGHVHERAEEVIYVLSGSGEVHVGKEIATVVPGSAVFVPAGLEHSVNNTSQETLRLACAFSPPVDIGNYDDIVYGSSE